MKSRTLRRLLLAGLILVVCVVLLTACGNTENPAETQKNNDPGKTDSGAVLSFVAADKTNWDMEVALGDLNYTLVIDLNADNTVTLKATCVGRVEANNGGGNQGGSGGEEETQAPVETQPPLTDAEKQAASFEQTGSWTKQDGYGYTITLPNGAVKTDFDKASSRTYFYAHIEKDGIKSELAQFQAKDSAFRKEVAADYEDYEVREAEYTFHITVQQNNNPNSTTLYLEKDGEANSLVYQGSTPTYKRGAWNIDPEDNLLTVYIEDEMIKADRCDAAGKEGWRIKYNDQTMYCSDSGAEVEYTSEDFEGKVVKELPGANGVTLKFTEKGFVNLVDGEDVFTGKYTEENGVLTVTIDGETFTSENGAISVSVKKSTGSGSGGDSEPTVYSFNLDGSVPEGQPAPGGEGGSGGEGEGQPGEGEGEGPGAPEGGEGSGDAPAPETTNAG